MASDVRRNLGQAGEDRAAAWYRDRGWTVLARNWRDGRNGELDLIVGRDGLTVFVEVKTRTSDAFGSAAEAVTMAKQVRIRGLAMAWLVENQRNPGRIRFDVVAITSGTIEVIDDAF